MKKAIFIILLILPVFLMITISIAGRLIVMYVPMPVESVHFVDENGEEITELEIGKNKTAIVKAMVLPELATNKNVVYTIIAQNENDAEFSYDDQTGELKGLKYGVARLKVVTEEKKLESVLVVTVSDKSVSGVVLNETTLTLSVNASFTLRAFVEPETAVNKVVSWSSSNPEYVQVNSVGVVKAIKPTLEDEPVLISATTEDGGFMAVCEVTVTSDKPMLAFYRIDEQDPLPYDESIIVNDSTLDLALYIRYDETLIQFEEIGFRRSAGSGAITDGHYLTFSKSGEYINVIASVTRDGVVICEYSAVFIYRP